MGPLPDNYAVLGVLPASEDVVIRGAYLALIKKYYPDTFAGSRDYAERKSKEINAAYAVLSDPQWRKAYDELRSTRTQETSRPRSEAQGSRSSRGTQTQRIDELACFPQSDIQREESQPVSDECVTGILEELVGCRARWSGTLRGGRDILWTFGSANRR